MESATHEHPDTILVVEDNTLVRMDCADVLKEAGFRVLEAEDADAAMLILERAREVRLLFSDIDMPGSMDGLALASLVHTRWPRIRLLMMSGHHRMRDADLPYHGQFLPKPYSPVQVVQRIRGLLMRAG